MCKIGITSTGEVYVTEYDESRANLSCHYNIIQIPVSILNDDFLRKLKETKEPIELKKE